MIPRSAGAHNGFSPSIELASVETAMKSLIRPALRALIYTRCAKWMAG
jgi:hypothetical protein